MKTKIIAVISVADATKKEDPQVKLQEKIDKALSQLGGNWEVETPQIKAVHVQGTPYTYFFVVLKVQGPFIEKTTF